MLALTRPLVFFDVETTGIDPFHDRIIEIGAVKIFPDGTQKEYRYLINPGQPIPAGSTAIHNITDDMVADKPYFRDLAEELRDIFFNADLGGYNIKIFDLPLLITEFKRVGLVLDYESINIVDAMAIFKIKEPRTLTAAYKKYCGKELENAHSAVADIRATIEVLEGQLTHYEDLPRSPETLHAFCFPKDPNAFDAEGKLLFVNGNLTINFGKNKGKSLQELSLNDPYYLEWILNGSFPDKVKKAVRDALNGVFAAPPSTESESALSKN